MQNKKMVLVSRIITSIIIILIIVAIHKEFVNGSSSIILPTLVLIGYYTLQKKFTKPK